MFCVNCVYDRHRCNSRGAHRDYKESHVRGLDSRPEVSPWGARHGTGGGYTYHIIQQILIHADIERLPHAVIPAIQIYVCVC